MSSLVTDRYKAGELPRGWAEAQLDEIAEVILGQSPPGTSYNDEGRGMAFLQGKAEFGALRPTVRKWTTDPRKLAREDDVLLSVRAPVGPTNLAPTDCCIGRGLAAIRPRAGIDPIFVLYAIRATAPVLAAQATGSTFEAVTGAQVRAHRLPVPPLNEQRRIVAAIEEHLSRLDAADASLNVAAARIGGLRQAIVDSARHTSSRIEIRELLTEPLANGRSVVSAEQGFPVLRLSAMKDGFIDFDESKIGAWKASEAAPWTVRAGDFFVSRGNGSLRLVGRGALAGSPPKAIAFPDTLIRLRVDEARLLLSYLRIIWNTSEMSSSTALAVW